MNTASRMESNSQACRINLSPEAAAALLAQAPDVVLLPRGVLEIKGKGPMEARPVLFKICFVSLRRHQRHG